MPQYSIGFFSISNTYYSNIVSYHNKAFINKLPNTYFLLKSKYTHKPIRDVQQSFNDSCGWIEKNTYVCRWSIEFLLYQWVDEYKSNKKENKFNNVRTTHIIVLSLSWLPWSLSLTPLFTIQSECCFFDYLQKRNDKKRQGLKLILTAIS